MRQRRLEDERQRRRDKWGIASCNNEEVEAKSRGGVGGSTTTGVTRQPAGKQEANRRRGVQEANGRGGVSR